MTEKRDDEVASADADADVPVAPPRAMSLHELELLEEELRPLVEPAHARPEVSAANYAIGVADELGRLILSFVLATAVLIALAVALTPWLWIAVALTPWLWIAVAAWIALAVVTIVGLRRRRRRGSAPRLTRSIESPR